LLKVKKREKNNQKGVTKKKLEKIAKKE